MPAADPNWLLSTTAQSAAAIVAIVGGFLVSRLVSLSAERNGLGRRRDELDRLIEVKIAELEGIQARIDHQAREWFFGEAMVDLIEADDTPDPDQLVSRYSQAGWSPEDSRAAAERLVAVVRAGLAAFEKNPYEFVANHEDPAWLAAAGVPIESGWEEVSKRAAAAIIEAGVERESDDPYGLLMPNNLALDHGENRHDARISRLESVSSDIETLGAEREIVIGTLARVGRPEGVILGIGVLVGFALVGIVFPLIVLAIRPVPTSPWMRFAVVAGFVAGLGAVVAYIVSAVRRLAPD